MFKSCVLLPKEKLVQLGLFVCIYIYILIYVCVLYFMPQVKRHKIL